MSHPFAPEWQAEKEQHLAWWKESLVRRQAAGADFIAITPEFGPRTYMPTLPFTYLPVADTWAVNLAMRDWLRTELAVFIEA